MGPAKAGTAAEETWSVFGKRHHYALACSQLDLWESITDVLPSHNWLKHLQWTKPLTQYRDGPNTNIWLNPECADRGVFVEFEYGAAIFLIFSCDIHKPS